MTAKIAQYFPLTQLPYPEAWQLQKQLFQARREGAVEDTLLFVEHPHTFTIGKTGEMGHLLLGREQMEAEGIHFELIDRGGDITYHGPKQLVAYPIFDLNNYKKDLHHYLRQLEDVVIGTLARVGISAGRNEGLTGVWVDGAKICAIGVKVSRWITMHGLALNVDPDLSFFSKIVPCGISDKPVTSIRNVLGKDISMGTIQSAMVQSFEDVFQISLLKAKQGIYDYA